jgi:hypothetical protein
MYIFISTVDNDHQWRFMIIFIRTDNVRVLISSIDNENHCYLFFSKGASRPLHQIDAHGQSLLPIAKSLHKKVSYAVYLDPLNTHSY